MSTVTIAEFYADFAESEARDESPAYALLGLAMPEQAHRRARLRAATAVAAADPPLPVRGGLSHDLAAPAAQAPPDATLVVFDASVLYQVPAPRQEKFAALVRELPAHWLANGTADLVPGEPLPQTSDDAAYNLLGRDGRPQAWTRSHGQAMTWLADGWS